MEVIDESIFDRLAEQFRFRCRSDERERIDGNSYISSFRHDHIDDKIFHRDVEHFFDIRFESVNFIDEKDIALLKDI